MAKTTATPQASRHCLPMTFRGPPTSFRPTRPMPAPSGQIKKNPHSPIRPSLVTIPISIPDITAAPRAQTAATYTRRRSPPVLPDFIFCQIGEPVEGLGCSPSRPDELSIKAVSGNPPPSVPWFLEIMPPALGITDSVSRHFAPPPFVARQPFPK